MSTKFFEALVVWACITVFTWVLCMVSWELISEARWRRACYTKAIEAKYPLADVVLLCGKKP